MGDFTGGTAVITGAAGGIGRALARSCAYRDMRVVLADIDERGLAESAAMLAGAETLTVPTDVSDPASVDSLAEAAISRFGRVDVVCNNAGLVLNGMSWSVTPEQWQRIMAVNFFGVVNGMRSFVPLLREQNSGHVVNTASMAGVTTGPGLSPYAASKHAVVAVSESLYKELVGEGSGVRVSIVCPGMVITAMSAMSHRSAAADGDVSAAPALLDDAVRAVSAGAITAEAVAAQVQQAILDERLWVFTHPERLGAITERARDMTEGRNPAPTYP